MLLEAESMAHRGMIVLNASVPKNAIDVGLPLLAKTSPAARLSGRVVAAPRSAGTRHAPEGVRKSGDAERDIACQARTVSPVSLSWV